jgi:hypothetical protein
LRVVRCWFALLRNFVFTTNFWSVRVARKGAKRECKSRKEKNRAGKKEDVFPPARLTYSYVLFHAKVLRKMQKKKREEIANKERRRLPACTANLQLCFVSRRGAKGNAKGAKPQLQAITNNLHINYSLSIIH